MFPEIVHRLRFAWVAFFFVLTVAGLVVLLYKPGLQLPTSTDFQMFDSNHPLEAYDLYLKDRFRFESSTSQDGVTFNIYIFWGLEAMDTGDWLDPYDFGELRWDKSFDIAHPDSQRWLLHFCRKLREQDFYAKKSGIEEKCFIETFYNQSCDMDPLTRIVRFPCCKNSSSLFDKRTLSVCSTIAAYQHAALQYQKVDPSIGYIIYEGEEMKGISMHITSTIPLSRAYEPARKFWTKIETWMAKEMETAPPGMRNGWFISQLEFYDLQRSLSDGTVTSMGISVLTAFAVMLLTTMNIFVSIYAITTIIGILSLTIGTLVLGGWKLNILESITMSVAVGLSIDLAMHFGVAYCLATNKNCRKARVAFSLSRMGSAITMAAVTTFIAGALMMPSHVLSYIQLGHFLMLVMSVSWAFSTFFFQSLCSIAGPQGNFGQLVISRLWKKKSPASHDSDEELKPLHSNDNVNDQDGRCIITDESSYTDDKHLPNGEKMCNDKDLPCAEDSYEVKGVVCGEGSNYGKNLHNGEGGESTKGPSDGEGNDTEKHLPAGEEYDNKKGIPGGEESDNDKICLSGESSEKKNGESGKKGNDSAGKSHLERGDGENNKSLLGEEDKEEDEERPGDKEKKQCGIDPTDGTVPLLFESTV